MFKRFWQRLIQVGPNTDFVHAGDDLRWNPFGVPAWIQRHTSWQAAWEPLSLMSAIPPFVVLNVPLNFKGTRYLVLRAGWRYDRTWPGYIFEAASKVLDHTMTY